VIGVVLTLVGVLILLGLLAASPSALTGGLIRLLGQLIGWGLYFLPIGLIAFGLWLILRKIERVPPPSLERAIGSVLLFAWALTVMHSIIAAPEMAIVAARDGAGGGYIGALFERALWNSFGLLGLIVALLAWMLSALTMVLDMRLHELLAWMGPLLARLEAFLKKPIHEPPLPAGLARSNGFTPMPPSASAPQVTDPAAVLACLAYSQAAALPRGVPDLYRLDAGTAGGQRGFHQSEGHRSRTLASFGAQLRWLNQPWADHHAVRRGTPVR
jgi:hypothetical protein